MISHSSYSLNQFLYSDMISHNLFIDVMILFLERTYSQKIAYLPIVEFCLNTLKYLLMLNLILKNWLVLIRLTENSWIRLSSLVATLAAGIQTWIYVVKHGLMKMKKVIQASNCKEKRKYEFTFHPITSNASLLLSFLSLARLISPYLTCRWPHYISLNCDPRSHMLSDLFSIDILLTLFLWRIV